MAYGMEVYKSNGELLVGGGVPGGNLYMGMITRAAEAAGITTMYTFNNVGNTFAPVFLFIGGGGHYVSGFSQTSSGGVGKVDIYLTSLGVRTGGFAPVPTTRILVFTRSTSEDGYGLLHTNDAGERLISAYFPAAEFLGIVTPSSTPTYTSPIYGGGYTKYTHQATTSLGSGRTRLILWNIPSTNEDAWFNGTSYVLSSVTGSYAVSANWIRQSSAAVTMPQALVFALDGLTPSASPYGMQVFNGSGQLMFDSSLNHMNIKSFGPSVNYPSGELAVNTQTLSDMTGASAIFIPSYTRETWSATGPAMSQGKVLNGAIRREGTTQYSTIVQTESYMEDIAISGSYTYGSASAVQPIVNGALYGASTFPLTGRTAQISGTASCSYDSGYQANCQSSSTHKAWYRGGTGGAITYLWSIPSNPGGFSFSGSTTAQTCTIVKTGTGTEVGTNYSCTLRCVITVGGDSVTVDRTVTHNHSSYFFGGGGDDGA